MSRQVTRRTVPWKAIVSARQAAPVTELEHDTTPRPLVSRRESARRILDARVIDMLNTMLRTVSTLWGTGGEIQRRRAQAIAACPTPPVPE